MRTKIVGDNLAARTLRGFLLETGLAVTDHLPTYTITFMEAAAGTLIVDGIDCPLEHRAVNALEEIGFEIIVLKRGGGVRDDRALTITYPVDKDMEVATAIYRALVSTFVTEKKKKRWYWPLAVLLLLAPSPAHAQYTIGRAWDSVTVLPVDPGDSANRALRVNVVAGGAGGGISQLQVRSAGGTWTDIGFAGGNLNVPVNCITGCAGGSNPSIGTIGATTPTSATLAGMDFAGNMVALSATPTGALKSLNVALRDAGGQDLDFATNAGTYSATDHGMILVGYDGATNYRTLRTTTNGTLRIDPIGTTAQPVTGTFWQTTQPVSGTFWQGTQPVSGTFWPTTVGSPLSARLGDGSNFATFTGTSINMNCTGGCGGASSFLDNSAFTGGTSAVNNMGALYDTTPPTITDGNAGIPRMNVNRFLYVDGSQVTQPVSGTFWQATQPVSLASMPSTPVTGTFWQATQPVSGTFWQTTQPISIASMPSTPVTGTFWQATQPVSGTVTITPPTLTKGTQGATGLSVQELKDAGRTTRMFTANVASTATAETLITLTFSNNLASTSTCSSCAITTGKKFRFQSVIACARISTGTNTHTVTLNLRGAVGGATTASSPLQMTLVQTLAASSTSCNAFALADLPDGVEYDANSGTNTFGMTITDPGWVTAAQIVTFVISVIAFEY